MMNDMVSMADYADFGQGFGIGSMAEVANLNKALTSGEYAQVNGVDAQVNGAALQVESLEHSLKVLTFSQEHIKLWKKIPKSEAHATVEEYNQLLSYGEPGGGFVAEGELPATQDSRYRRQSVLVKYLGTTREVTHQMTLVRTAHGNAMARENQNGILWILRQLEHGLFWGNSKLAAMGGEGVQFDGLDTLIPEENTIDLKGEELDPKAVNAGALMITENYGIPTDLFLSYETMTAFSEAYFPKERIVMPLQNGVQAGVVVSRFNTLTGSVEFNPDRFLQKTKPLSPIAVGGVKAPTAPGAVTITLGAETDAEFHKSGAGTYAYAVTAANRYGESVPVDGDTDIAITQADLAKGVKITVRNAGTMVVEPEWFNVYRTEADGSKKYLIMRIPAQSVTVGGNTSAVDKNIIMPNTYTAFMGEMSPNVLEFKQLAPLMKMDLGILGPVYRWMILLYGTPTLYMPGRWVKFRNIKASDLVAPLELYQN